MLAHDVPYAIVQHWGRISLPEYLDYNRNGRGWGKSVTAWHITPKSNIDSIKSNGLRTATHTQGVSCERPAAVYLFCSRSVVDRNIRHLIDRGTEYTILTITIPANQTHKLYPDNLYNMSIDDAEMSAMQYRDDIPANWIVTE